MQLKFRQPTDLLHLSLSSSSAHSSRLASPSLASVSEDNETDMGYFGRGSKYSPTSESASDAESDAGSDITLEEAAEIFAGFGHPLERIPRIGGIDDELSLEDCQELGHGTIYHPGVACTSLCTSLSPSISSVTSSLTCVSDYQAIVGILLKSPQTPFDDLDPQNFVTFDPSPSTSLSSLSSSSPLMIKRIARDSQEVSLLLELNTPELRQDPWNPCPHVLRAVDHDAASEHLFVCMERLHEYNSPPMSTVAQYIDFFRQILEGLSFLHEHNLVGFSCSDPSSYMVDLSSGPYSNNASITSLLSATSSLHTGASTPLKSPGHRDHSPHHHQYYHHHSVTADVALFDRSIYPVRYYFVNFSHARRLDVNGPVRDRTVSIPSPSISPSKHPLGAKQPCPYKEDVKDLGNLMENMLIDTPTVVSIKFKSLIKAMTIGGFGAEDSRKLFEALCRSLEAGVFDMSVRSGAGLRSQSVDIPSSGTSTRGSTYAPSKTRGYFGLEPDTGALSS
ncbi:hypothetical protein AN958_03622 [Leucoagaricus sp. SymC.cos]|nr:hypothetical protein AN958_03622 [Leucoagaricus sp. SymC.cos]